MLIKNMLDDLGDADISKDNPIPVMNVTDAVLTKVIEWCEHHRGDPATNPDEDDAARKKMTEIDEWDQKFMQVDQEMLFEIILVCLSPSPMASFWQPMMELTVLPPISRHPTTSTSSPSSMSAARPLRT